MDHTNRLSLKCIYILPCVPSIESHVSLIDFSLTSVRIDSFPNTYKSTQPKKNSKLYQQPSMFNELVTWYIPRTWWFKKKLIYICMYVCIENIVYIIGEIKMEKENWTPSKKMASLILGQR